MLSVGRPNQFRLGFEVYMDDQTLEPLGLNDKTCRDTVGFMYDWCDGRRRWRWRHEGEQSEGPIRKCCRFPFQQRAMIFTAALRAQTDGSICMHCELDWGVNMDLDLLGGTEDLFEDPWHIRLQTLK